MGGLNTTTKPIEVCQRIVRSLDSNAASPRNVMADANVLDRIIAPDNVAGWEVSNTTDLAGKPAPNNQVGSIAKVLLTYEKPFCAGGTSSNTKLCDVNAGSAEDPNGWLELTVDKYAERHFVLTKEEYNNRCENPDAWITNKLRRLAYEIKQEINSNIITELHGLADNYATDGTPSIGVTAKPVTIVDPNGNIFNAGLTKIKKEYRKANFKGNTLIFGGDMLATYMDLKDLAGRNPSITEPGSMDPLATMPFIYDSQFDAEFQDLEEDENSHGISIPLGGFYMHQWFLHTGYRREVTDPNVVRIKMMIDGMEFDYGMLYDPCGGPDKTGGWKFQLSKHYGFASIPANIYCNGQGLNFHWLFNCGDASCASF
jgi:hypothetical protein